MPSPGSPHHFLTGITLGEPDVGKKSITLHWVQVVHMFVTWIFSLFNPSTREKLSIVNTLNVMN